MNPLGLDHMPRDPSTKYPNMKCSIYPKPELMTVPEHPMFVYLGSYRQWAGSSQTQRARSRWQFPACFEDEVDRFKLLVSRSSHTPGGKEVRDIRVHTHMCICICTHVSKSVTKVFAPHTL